VSGFGYSAYPLENLFASASDCPERLKPDWLRTDCGQPLWARRRTVSESPAKSFPNIASIAGKERNRLAPTEPL